jgi:thiamine transport system ATP-binding protein
VSTPRVEVAAATVRFGERIALDGLDLAVAPGEVVSVLGPSGSGKSTLLRAIAGLQPLDAGAVRIDAVDQAPVAVHRRGVGLMFQDQALFPHRDVAGNVAFGLRMQGQSARAAAPRVAELLELVGLPGAEHRPVAELSGGEQQRVALARALAPAPSVLLLDEPLGALDRTLRDRLVGELRELFTELSLTVIAVTHDQAEAFALADRIAVMDAGRVLQAGPPAVVWGAPASRRVAELLGLTNLVDGVVARGIAATPWGPLPVPGAVDGPVVVLVQPSGVAVDPHGSLDVTVRSATFQGGRTILELDPVGGPSLRAEVPSADAPAAGTPVRVTIDPAAVLPLPRD